MTEKLNAIIYCSQAQVNGKQFLKYHNIVNNEKKIASFLAFAAKFPGAEYVNFYYKKDRSFKERIYLQ